eukprot:390345-Ditylum_brightwellii.AAC.1
MEQGQQDSTDTCDVDMPDDTVKETEDKDREVPQNDFGLSVGYNRAMEVENLENSLLQKPNTFPQNCHHPGKKLSAMSHRILWKYSNKPTHIQDVTPRHLTTESKCGSRSHSFS